MKQILVINGHPYNKSFNHALTEAYIEGATSSNSTISRINIGDLKFNPNLQFGFSERMELGPDLLESIQKIKAADHIVWIFPIWWAGFPAIMKGFIDRAFLPGITFKPVEGKALPIKLLKGKTSRIIMTSDTPKWYNYLYLKSPAINQFKKGVLNYCGISPVKVTYIAPVKNSKPIFKEKWLKKAYKLGNGLK